MQQQTPLLAIFPYLHTLLSAVKVLQQAQLKVDTIYSPTPRHEISEALGLKPSPVRYFTLMGGLAGALTGLSLSVFAALKWHIITGGRPVVAWIPFVVVGFEFTILLAVLFTVAGMLITLRLPQRVIPNHYDNRFTLDKYGMLVQCPAGRCSEVMALLRNAGAEEVHEHTPCA